MVMNRDLRDSDAPAPHKKPKQKNAADSNTTRTDRVTTVAAGKSIESTNDGGTSRRESAVSAREHAAYLREETIDQRDVLAQARHQTADQRDDVAQGREQSVHLRETAAASREDILQESERLQATLESHIATLRQANENLVIATLQTQSMADEIQKAKDQMGHMAHHDFLTGLPNRILLEERLVQAISLAKRHRTKLAVLFIDLDRFKTINDSLGHPVGDALLQAVAQRLLGSVRSTDTVSRQGGDEFVALLSEVADESAVSVFADKMCKAVSSSYRLAEQDLHIGATLGISMYPDDGQDAETLIRHADVAMYYGKKSGGNSYSFFEPEMNVRAVERQRIEADLYRALEQQQFQLYYQAQVELQTGRILGTEALIRWRHPVRGLLLPGTFVPIAEGCGAIVRIGRWVLREACRQTQSWLDAGLPLPVVAVNISAHEFGADDFLENVRAILRETCLAPHRLELELTESALMKNAESTMVVLQELKSMGVKIAIDDFGTGYSSLSYLKQFPVDTLKIDQSFVADIATGGDGILIDSVISLGKSLGHHVIAEGIETAEQLAFLCKHDCAVGQGFYLRRPATAAEFEIILKDGMTGKALEKCPPPPLSP